jgi:chromosome segregation ATPase
MTRLSQLLAQNGPTSVRERSAADLTGLPPSSDGTIDPDPVEAESDGEASTRLGEECEALRNLIVAAGCKVNELEETKQAFIDIVDPANEALRALEHEKTRNISLTRKLGQLGASHDALHAMLDETEKKARAGANEKEQIKLALESEQRAVRELTAVKAELTNDVAVVRAMVATLEHQVAELSARAKALTEESQRFRSRALDAETKVNGLEPELSATRESLAIVQGENQSLQKSLAQAANDVSQFAKRNTDVETAMTVATERIQQLETTLSGVENDRNRLLTEVNELSERQRNAHTRLQGQFEALQARAAMAEKLLGNTRQLLATRSEEARSSSRQVADVKREREGVEARLREIEASVRAHESHIRELERTRTVLSERNAALVNALKSRDAQTAEADEQRLMAADQIARLEDETRITRMAFEKRIDELLSQLDHERLERQVVEGALDATRSERAQLQQELYTLRRAVRRGGRPPEEPETDIQTRSADEPDRSANAA